MSEDEKTDDPKELAGSLADTGSDDGEGAVEQILVAEGFDQ